jgi:adhesin transport system membrane fusion protein
MSIDDKKYVNSLYAQAYDKPKIKVDIFFILIIFLFSSAIIWANFATIDELARGTGKVIPTEKIQSVQSLDGGLIEEILVKTGERVKSNQILMKIDTTRFEASMEETREGYNQWLAMQVRLEAESLINIKSKTPKLKFSKEIKEKSKDYIKSESILFENRVEELKSSIRVFNSQLNQKRQELSEIRSKLKQLRSSLKLVKAQRKTIKRLVQSGVKSKVDMIVIEKEYQQLLGDIRSAQLSIPRSNYAINEAKNRANEKIRQFKTQAATKLQEISVQIRKAEAKMVSDTDKIEKTEIRSPVNGIVKEIFINTIGGVVKSGMDLINIVPTSDILLVEAKIDPRDIAFINPQQKAIVKITAYDFSIFGGLEGQIVEISADSIIDKESKEGKSYYKVVVKTDKNYLEKDGEKLPIIPGMIASVDIVTGEKTIMDFLLKPILKIKQNSLHER